MAARVPLDSATVAAVSASGLVETSSWEDARPRARLGTLAGLAVLTGYVYLADPDKGGAYPLCPSRTLFGVDCPACGGLRGTNALLHGRITEALDHNVLLPVFLGFFALLLGMWLLPLVGRPERTFHPPRWLYVTAGVILVAYTVARNLPFTGLDYLASTA